MKADVAVESYQYKAYDNKGNLVQGMERGVNEQAIIEKLRKQQLTPVSVNKVNLKKGGGRLTSAHIEEVTSQLALLLKSGLKIDKALQVLADNAANAKLQSVMSVVCQEVKQGRELWRALSEQTEVFDSLYIEMVRIGENSGRLPQVFEKLADNLKFQRELNKKITQAMVYPVFIMLVCLVSLAAIFNFVVPSMSGLFESLAEIPSYTQFLIDMSVWVQKYQFYVVFLVIAGVSVIVQSKSNPQVKMAIDRFLASFWVTKGATLVVERVRYSASMELMLSSGVDLAKAMSMAASTVNTPSLQSQLRQAQQDVSQGHALVDSLTGLPMFDNISLSLLKVGEETGQVDLVFGEINRRSRSHFESWMLKLTAMLEPLMIVIMGGIVGSVVVVMLLSIVSVNDVSF